MCPQPGCNKTFTRRTTLTRHQGHHNVHSDGSNLISPSDASQVPCVDAQSQDEDAASEASSSSRSRPSHRGSMCDENQWDTQQVTSPSMHQSFYSVNRTLPNPMDPNTTTLRATSTADPRSLSPGQEHQTTRRAGEGDYAVMAPLSGHQRLMRFTSPPGSSPRGSLPSLPSLALPQQSSSKDPHRHDTEPRHRNSQERHTYRPA